MQSYETSTTVQPQGEIRVPGVPFAPGTEVEVSIIPKRRGGAEFAVAWNRVVAELRGAMGAREWSDSEIQREISDYRAEQ